MSAALITQLRDMGVALSLEGGRLRVDTKPDVLTDAIHDLIRLHRIELIVALTPEYVAPAIPAYIKRCDACSGTNRESISSSDLWGCLDCQDKPATHKAADDTICPSCGEHSIVTDATGRVCLRSACRFGKSGRKIESWPDFRESISVSLLAPMPEKSELLLEGATCPTCAVEVYGLVPCTHLPELRAQALANVLAQMEKRQPKGRYGSH